MKNLRILSVPSVAFAHSFEASTYRNLIPARPAMIEITYLQEGELTITTESNVHVATAGHLICNLFRQNLLIESQSYHHQKTVAVQVTYEFAESETIRLLDLPLIVPASEGCRNLIDEIISTNAVFPELSLKCSGLFLALLNEISEVNRRCKGDRESLDSPHVMRAKQYIYRNIHKPIRQKEIAEHLGITSEYLCAVFKKCEGCSVMSYINRTKLKGVYDLMEKEGLSLSRAASQYGYSDSNYVSRLYKRHFSVSITEAVEQSRNAGLIVYQT
jgi:AraC-like DNA-binding protein